MKTLGIYLCFLFISLNLSAQRSVSSAQIVTEENGSIRAYILNSTFEGTPQKFEYSLTEAGPFKEITARDIKSVKFDDGRFYEKHFIAVAVINNNYIHRSLYDYKDEKNLLRGHTLIEKLVDAPLALYQFKDKFDHAHFFYLTPSNNAVLYIENKSYQDENGVLFNDQSYKNVIAALINERNCASSISKATAKLNYAKKDMVRAFEAINACTGVEAVTYTKNKSAKFSASVLGGTYISKRTAFDGDVQAFPAVTGNVFGHSASPAFGVSIDLIPAKEVKNYIGSLELLHHTYSYTTDSIAQGYYKGVAKLNENMLHLNAVIRLRLGGNNVIPFLEGGGTTSYVYKSEIKATYLNTMYGEIGKVSSDDSKKDFNIGFLVGGGVEYNRLSLHGRYGFNGSFRNIAFLLKYSLLK